MELNKIYNEDCLKGAERIPSGSVDLILTDPPYGTVKNAPKNWTVGNKASHGWDEAVNPEDLFGVANRILRRNGRIVLFSQEPYTSRLITEAHPNIPFSYRMIWEKNDFANALLVNKAPVSYYEDILLFSKTHDTNSIHPLRSYFKSVMGYVGLNLKQINSTLGHRRAEHTFYVDSTQFSLCTEKTYGELINTFNINGMDGFIPYEKLAEIDRKTKDEHFPSTFNLWEGGKYKSNILKYRKDYDGYHPTQKPVLLLEDLIKTFSNEGDTVVDLTMGSGSTGVACINTGRNFIGFELDKNYFDIANDRIQKAAT